MIFGLERGNCPCLQSFFPFSFLVVLCPLYTTERDFTAGPAAQTTHGRKKMVTEGAGPAGCLPSAFCPVSSWAGQAVTYFDFYLGSERMLLKIFINDQGQISCRIRTPASQTCCLLLLLRRCLRFFALQQATAEALLFWGH